MKNINKDEFSELRDFLSELISYKSVKSAPADGMPFGKDCADCLSRFLEKARQDGFQVKNCEGFAGVVEFGEGRGVAALCHLDVVPAEGWPEAFDAEIDEEFIVGRGAIDDKGPAVAVYLAMKRLKNSGYKPKGKIQLILGIDEESGSECMKYYREHYDLPAAGFTADADFPVINAEKGIMNFEISLDKKQDPKQRIRLRKAEGGTRANVVPGLCKLEWMDENGTYEEDTEGVSGHASSPESAKNAISFAMKGAGKKLSKSSCSHPFVDLYNNIIGSSFDGEKLGVSCSDEVSGALTLNVGKIVLNEEGGKILCDIRYPVTANSEVIRDKIRRRCEESGASFRLISDTPPLFFPKEHPLIQALEGVYRRLSGSDGTAVSIGGGTYARQISNIAAFGPTFPGEPSLAHQNGEKADLNELYETISYYEEAFKELDKIF